MRVLPKGWQLIRPSAERPDPFPDSSTCDGCQAGETQPTLQERRTETSVEYGVRRSKVTADANQLQPSCQCNSREDL